MYTFNWIYISTYVTVFELQDFDINSSYKNSCQLQTTIMKTEFKNAVSTAFLHRITYINWAGVRIVLSFKKVIPVKK